MSNPSRETAPPVGLEDRVVDALRARGLLAPAPIVRRGLLTALRVAAALVLFASGYAAGTWRPSASLDSSTTTARRFVLLLHGVAAGPTTDAEKTARVDEYRAWARSVQARGVPISGERLKSSFGESISGFFIIEAASLEAAREIADSCPHARSGQRVEVREIDPM